MEGALVSAKRVGSTITITVVSDAEGRYTFPRTRLEPGSYLLRVRAVGYELNDPGYIEVPAQRPAQVDLKLRKTRDLAAQLTNAEWLMSAPGTWDQKRTLRYCVNCHTLERIFRTDYTTDELNWVVARMSSYTENTDPLRPMLRLLRDGPSAGGGLRFPPGIADYLSTVNLRTSLTWQFPLKTFARPKGRATRAIITEYDLPRRYQQPHDVVLDSSGVVWYSDFERPLIGRLDPKTGKVVQYAVPSIKKGGVPYGIRKLTIDYEDNPWINLGSQGAVGKFDRKTEKFETWSIPKVPGSDRNPGTCCVEPLHIQVDGKAWVLLNGNKIQRVDVRTGVWLPEPIDAFRDLPKDSPAFGRDHNIYDIYSDSHNNLYLTDNFTEIIGRVDAKTLKVNYYLLPTRESYPRRGHVDKQDRFWFGEYQGNRIGLVDPKTDEVKEWEDPTPYSWTYDAVLDKNGEVWSGGMTSDRVARLNPKTGEFVEYLLPRSTNIRLVEVDNSTNPVTFWVGNNHAASIIKLEPLE
jgi:virginiamycin B lyase